MHWLQLNYAVSERKALFGVDQCKTDFHSLPFKQQIQAHLVGHAEPCPPKGAQFNLSNSAFPDC